MRKAVRTYQASMTVEMSVLMPLVLMIVMLSILATFYYHDKNVLQGAAYETAVVGSTKMREREIPTESKLKTLCEERIGRKCIFFGRTRVKVAMEEEEIIINVTAKKRWFQLKIEQKAKITEPEKKIRDVRRLKEIGNGAKDHD